MTYNSYDIQDFALTLPITQEARQTAEQFAREQLTPEKAEQVRLNTLAVSVVNNYFQMMDVPTNLELSDSWNPVMRMFSNVADLEVMGVGRLECRPVLANESSCYIPPEVWEERIGYVVVQIDESSLEATLWGFTQTVATEELAMSQLAPIEDVFDCLQPMTIAAATTAAIAETTAAVQKTRVNLSQWLEEVFETGWQTVDALFKPAELEFAYNFRKRDITEDNGLEVAVKRAKLINFGTQLANNRVALIIELTPESDQKKNILLQVHPMGKENYLPPQLQLTVLDESGLIFLEAQSRSEDNFIQLQFAGLAGELFSIQVAFADASIIEDFVI
ncbi:MAG: DUF1822 family protein [Symploca sp. SIO2C1]|nr:DUF1822 family protein [Symploca sp. SIO2C1]